MKIFISSVISGLEIYRDASVRSARSLGHEVRRSEDFSASPATPQQACLAGVRWADVTVVLLGSTYGTPQRSGLSATHEEYREARGSHPVLIFVQHGVTREPQQDGFVIEVRDWSRGHVAPGFRTPEELGDAVTRALHDLELAQMAGGSDEAEMLSRAQAMVPREDHTSQSTLTLVVTGGPRREILRPAELENPELEADIARESLFGRFAILTDPLARRIESEIAPWLSNNQALRCFLTK